MKLYYVHDPMCSWCWAFRPTLDKLKKKIPAKIKFITLLGGLAKDTKKPMPEETREYIQNHWRRIQQEVPSTEFNFDFWKNCIPRRSTYPACRAVIAARQQGDEYDDLMTHAIQRAYYLEARNPSDNETLIELADETGIDPMKFSDDLTSEKTSGILLNEIKNARALGLNSFPGFLLMNDETMLHMVPDYRKVEPMLRTIKQFYS